MFNAASSTSIIAAGVRQYSTAALDIPGFAITVTVAIFVFRWGFWQFVNHTSAGSWLGHKGWKWVAAGDRWSFRHSKQFKRMIGDA